MSKTLTRTLVKFTLLAAFDDKGPLPHLEDLGDRLAEMIRDVDGVVTVASEYDSVAAKGLAEEDADLALAQAFPTDTLAVGPCPGLKVLGRNGTL